MIFFWSCQKISDQELRDNQVVLIGVLQSGKQPAGIQLFKLNSEDGSRLEMLKTQATILPSESAVLTELQWSSEGYFSNDGPVIQPNQSYTIEISEGNNIPRATAIFQTPPEIVLNSLSEDTVVISGPGTVASIFSWNALDQAKYSYVVKLENLEEDKIEIPFAGGLFSERYVGPQINANFLLLKDDFKYFGLHRITVIAVNRDFEELFFYDAADIRGLLRNGPDNVNGCHGFIAGTSGFSFEVFVSP